MKDPRLAKIFRRAKKVCRYECDECGQMVPCKDFLAAKAACEDLTMEEALRHPKAQMWAYRYARDVIKCRWLEAEAVIATDAYWAYIYALDVIQGQWPEAEKMINASEWKGRYAHYVWPGEGINERPKAS